MFYQRSSYKTANGQNNKLLSLTCIDSNTIRTFCFLI